MRLWCHECGKSCGRLDKADGGGWQYVGRSSMPRTDQHALNKLPIHLKLSDLDAPVLALVCSSGHWSALNVAEALKAARSGHDSHALSQSLTKP